MVVVQQEIHDSHGKKPQIGGMEKIYLLDCYPEYLFGIEGIVGKSLRVMFSGKRIF